MTPIEFRAAAEWYDQQRQGLGDQFLSAVDAAVASASGAQAAANRLKLTPESPPPRPNADAALAGSHRAD